MRVSDVPAGAGASSAEAFDAFYQCEYASVVRLALALTGRRAVAEELAQDGFEAAYRNWDRVRVYDEPGAWVRRVVANRCVSAWRRGVTEAWLRARLRRERVPVVELPERVEEVWAAVRALPRRQRQAIALVVLEDHSVTEVARVLACSEESVRTHLRRARRTLARHLQVVEDGDDA